MTRQELKNVVKECLVEILSEGLSGTQKTISESRQTSRQHQQPAEQRAQTVARPNIADKISFLPNKEDIKRTGKAVTESNQHLARSLTSDPVLADIFADTANRGVHMNMQESSGRISHEQMVSTAGDAAAKVMMQSDPEDVFGDSASKWAALAFADKIPSRS